MPYLTQLKGQFTRES
ncbi:hypothetical protein ACVXG8_14885 [Escherichia coli]